MKWLHSIGLSLLTAFFMCASLFTVPNISFAAKSEYKIEINKRDNKLYLYKNNVVINSYPVATGREEKLTPEGVFKIGPKVKYPQWYNAKKKKTVPGWTEDYPKKPQENPLGPRWMGLIVNGDNGNTYGIHGTNDESSIGKYKSSGCIRMHVKHIIELFNIVPQATPVWIHSGTSTGVWMNEDSIKDVKALTGRVQVTDRINIRKNPSTAISVNIIGKANKNAQFVVTGETKDWYRIKFNGNQVGFISKLYAKLVTETPKPDPKPVTRPDPNPVTRPDPKPVTQPNPDSKPITNTRIPVTTSFTKAGELKIQATLPNIKKASGVWKITLDGRVVAEKKGEEPTFTWLQKNPQLVKEQVDVKVEFTGLADRERVKGIGSKSFVKENIGIHIKPAFKDNKLHIEASLKANQDAYGLWTVQLGKTKKVFLQSGTKLTAVFDSVTFDKREFPTKIEFKGFTAKAYITASYTKDLDIKIPVPPDASGSIEEEKDEKEEKEEKEKKEEEYLTDKTDTETKDTEKSNTNPDDQQVDEDQEPEQEANQENLTGPPQVQTVMNHTGSEEDHSNNNSKQESNQNPNTKQTASKKVEANQVGGQLPKTSTSYPIGILLGLSCLAFGLLYLRKKRQV